MKMGGGGDSGLYEPCVCKQDGDGDNTIYSSYIKILPAQKITPEPIGTREDQARKG